MPTQRKKNLCRAYAAKYLGVSSATLKKLPVPYVQYSRFGYATYKKTDLDKFKQSRTFIPAGDVLGEVA